VALESNSMIYKVMFHKSLLIPMFTMLKRCLNKSQNSPFIDSFERSCKQSILGELQKSLFVSQFEQSPKWSIPKRVVR
jgi:hypothetical protein